VSDKPRIETVTIRHILIYTHSSQGEKLISSKTGRSIWQVDLLTEEYGKINGKLPFNPTHRSGWLPGEQQVIELEEKVIDGTSAFRFRLPDFDTDRRKPLTLVERFRLVENAVDELTMAVERMTTQLERLEIETHHVDG
jgi:hypothetical protein